MEILTQPTIEEIARLHPADIADRLQRLPMEESRALLCQLSTPVAALVLAELEEDFVTELLAELSVERLSRMLSELPNAQAADLVAALQGPEQELVFKQLPAEVAAKIRSLLRYAEDTAGGIMSDRYIALREDQTVQECQELLRSRAEEQMEDVSYLYVTDPDKRLVGVVSLRDLVFRKPDRPIREIMNRKVAYVTVTADQEAIAREFQQYHYLGLPVLDKERRLIGVVRANDVIGVLREEATEDMQLMVGLSGEERALSSWGKSIKRRLPWLYLNLATAFMAGGVVGIFENTIAALPMLAIFMPIVAGMGGNAGAQTLTIIIRDLALGELSPGDGRRALLKELVVALCNGLAIGIVVAFLGYLWKGQPVLGVIVALAMLLNLLAAGLAGVLVPYSLKALNIDPALASSIFVTTITDIAGFFFFLGLASLGMQWLMP